MLFVTLRPLWIAGMSSTWVSRGNSLLTFAGSVLAALALATTCTGKPPQGV